jgi:type II secretory pathway pseudopilin PulG
MSWGEDVVPARMVIVRSTSIDSLVAGSLVRSVLPYSRTTSLSSLAAAVPPSWLTITGDTARLDAAVVVTGGVQLNIDRVRTLQLVGGTDPRSSAFLSTGRGRIHLSGVTVTSVDPISGHPVAPDAAGRPYIRVSTGGTLDATDSTLADLGTQTDGTNPGEPALAFDRSSTGTLTRTRIERGSTGLLLDQSRGVALHDVTVSAAADNGIVLRSDRNTDLVNVVADHNGGIGVRVEGVGVPRPISGITTVGNHSYGVSVSGQSNVVISNLTLSNDQLGGLELSRTTNSTVHDVTTTDEPTGIFLHVDSTNVVLTALTVNGGRTGVVVEKTTTGLRVADSTIHNASLVGLLYDGRDAAIDRLTITDSGTALRVERGAGTVTLTALNILGGGDGLVTSADTSAVMVKDLSADGVNNDAIRTLGTGMHITGGQIRGAGTAIDLQAAATVTGITIRQTGTAVRVRTPEPITLDGIRIDSAGVGVTLRPGDQVALRNSVVHALHAVRGGDITAQGTNDLSLPPLDLLGAIGLPVILVAVLLELLNLVRHRKTSRPRALPPTLRVPAQPDSKAEAESETHESAREPEPVLADLCTAVRKPAELVTVLHSRFT